MVVDADPERDALRRELPAAILAVLARATRSAAGRDEPTAALRDLAEAARTAAGADLVLVRAAGSAGAGLEAVAGAGPAALVAELLGGRLPAAELPPEPLDALDAAPEAVRHAARRSASRSLLLVPVPEDGGATLELLRAGSPFSPCERRLAELVAGEVGLVLRAAAGRDSEAAPASRSPLEAAGDALAAALDDAQAPREIVRLAAELTGAPVAILWERAQDGTLTTGATHGIAADADVEPARPLAEQALAAARPVSALPAERLPARCVSSTTVPLGRPPVGVLQLLHASYGLPASGQIERLTTFAVRAAGALRANANARMRELELDRTRAVLAIVGRATADLSLAHTLEIAVDGVADLFGVDRIAVYLRSSEDGTLALAAGRGVEGGQTPLAERLLELALAARGQTAVEVDDVSRDARLRGAGGDQLEAGARGVLAAPLLVHGEAIGLIAVHSEAQRRRDEDDAALLAALAGQLAVAVQNARLHERATQLVEEREAALRAERAAARRLRVLYEVSRSFAQSLSLDETLETLARTAVDVLDLDAAAIRMPDERRERLVARAVYVRDSQLAEPVHALLARPTPFGARSVQRVFRDALPVRFDASTGARQGTIAQALAPFLDKGWTAALVPVATKGEVIASLAILSCRPGTPVTEATIDAAVAVVGQAALAIDNARLYQQQKRFADTMQRSLLPRSGPAAPGLETGRVYESSARLDVGGDLFDFLVLADGRLAAVLGDVTGHGVDATADMAMAKFVFRSLAREHPGPGELLTAANDVVLGEIAPDKFITMTCLVVDGARGEVACASAGHPAPRLLRPDGRTSGLDASGPALGIDAGPRFEETRAALVPGAALVLYTDGVVEARRDGELYGVERLDALLAECRDLPAQTLAEAVAEDARAFAGGELSDDLAVVVIRRTP